MNQIGVQLGLWIRNFRGFDWDRWFPEGIRAGLAVCVLWHLMDIITTVCSLAAGGLEGNFLMADPAGQAIWWKVAFIKGLSVLVFWFYACVAYAMMRAMELNRRAASWAAGSIFFLEAFGGMRAAFGNILVLLQLLKVV